MLGTPFPKGQSAAKLTIRWKGLMAKSKTKGIYSIEINNKYYIGKDVEIFANRRLKQHLLLLKINAHYNTYLQNAYNKYGEKSMIYSILTFDEEYSAEQLTQLERYFIDKFDSFKNGYNLTLGGEGMSGFKFAKETLDLRSTQNSGELNANAKLTNKQFFEIVELLKQGKTNQEIADIYNLHSRYVSLIRHKKRFKRLWKEIDNYDPVKSSGIDTTRSLEPEQFIDVVKKIRLGYTNIAIEREYNLASGTVSRIRHKRQYQNWWKKYINE